MATTRSGELMGGAARFFDDRLNSSSFVRRQLNKVFPDHWSFMIGEIALYSFIILILTGTYLALFFAPSDATVIYHGSYLPLQGVPVSEAFASTLHISFDVRAGLLIRQIHHWAADLFIAAMIVHMSRIFLTGAYRKPREINWLIGLGLLTLGIIEGFAGYSLPGDLLSGEGLRIAYSILLSIPVVGTWAAYFVFGGVYPGTEIESRLYIGHVLILPGLILALISAHLAIVWHQKHTQFARPGRTNSNVVGERMFPVYAFKGQGFFFLVFGVLALLGGLAQINPIWLYGPYNAYDASAGSQPDWYMGFLDGALRLMPNWEFRGLGYDIPFNVFLPAIVLPGILFSMAGMWPWLEKRFFGGDNNYHNIAQRPRENPRRSAIFVMSLTFYTILLASSSTDVMAEIFHISMNELIWIGRVGLFLFPPLMYVVTFKWCTARKEKDEEEEEHGYETGVIRMMPSGEFLEIHAPLPEDPVPPMVDVEQHPVLTQGPSAAATGVLEAYGSALGNGHGTALATTNGHPGAAATGNGADGGGEHSRRNVVSTAAHGLAGFFVKPDQGSEPPEG